MKRWPYQRFNGKMKNRQNGCYTVTMKLDRLIEIVSRLRGPDGCPWDREQTRDSLKKYLIEEFYELIDAVEDNDPEGMKEEMGDLLFQIVLQAQLSDEEGRFTMDDVIHGICEKMVQRHPHVFGDRDIATSDEVEEWWEENKRNQGKVHDSAIGGVPRSLPSLVRAQKIQQKATKVGFDWDNMDDVFRKIDEEVHELREAVARKDQVNIEDEIGDILFVLVRVANAVQVNPDDALRNTIDKFTRRFHYIEKEADRAGRALSDMSLDEMEALWQQAKRKNQNQSPSVPETD